MSVTVFAMLFICCIAWVTESDLYSLAMLLFDMILNVPSTIFRLCRDVSFWVEPVLS